MTRLKPSQTIASEIVFQSKFIKLKKDLFVSGNGNQGEYFYFTGNDAVMSVGVDNQENLILVEEYRYPIKCFLINASAGIVKSNEDYDKAALREFTEETGYTSARSTYLGKVPNLSGKADYYLRFYLFENCTQISNQTGGEATEETRVVKIPIKKIWDAIREEKIICAHTIAIIVKTLNKLKIQPRI